MNDDEIESRLVNALKGGAYLISYYLLLIGVFVLLAVLVATTTFAAINGMPLAVVACTPPLVGMMLFLIPASNKLDKNARRFLE